MKFDELVTQPFTEYGWLSSFTSTGIETRCMPYTDEGTLRFFQGTLFYLAVDRTSSNMPIYSRQADICLLYKMKIVISEHSLIREFAFPFFHSVV